MLACDKFKFCILKLPGTFFNVFNAWLVESVDWELSDSWLCLKTLHWCVQRCGRCNKMTCECLSPSPVLTKLYYSFNGVMTKNQNTGGSQRLLCLLCRTDSDNPLEKYFQQASDSKYNHRQQLYMKNKVRRHSKKQGETQLQFNVLILFSCKHT